MKSDDGAVDGASARTTRSRIHVVAIHTTRRPSSAVVECVRSLGLWTVCRLRRTCRGLRINRYRGVLGDRCHGSDRSAMAPSSSLAIVRLQFVDHHVHCQYAARPPSPPRESVTPKGPALVFGCHNIRSLANKPVDDLLDDRRDLDIDVLLLVETRHDADAVGSRRLRADGFQVVDRPRPRLHDNALSTNYTAVWQRLLSAAINSRRSTSVSTAHPASCCASESLPVRPRVSWLSSIGPDQ